MERLAPNMRKQPDISPEAWDQVVEHAPYIHERARWYYSQLMGRPIRYAGEPFHGTWQVRGYFREREAADFIEETFAGVLEAVGVAIQRYDKDKAQLNTYLDRVIRYSLNRELEYWEKSSSRQPGGYNADTDLFLLSPEDFEAFGRNTAEHAVDQDNDERLAVDPFEDEVFGVEQADVLLNMLKVREALTDKELFVIQRKIDGSSEYAIAEDLGIARATVQGAYRRAMRKARQALEETEDE